MSDTFYHARTSGPSPAPKLQKMRRLTQTAILALSTVAGAQARSTLIKPGLPVQPSPAAVRPASDYVLHLNDALEIQLPFSPEYNETVTIQPDGFIGLREAPPIPVSGKTVEQAEELIAQAYKGVLKDPKVSILLKTFLSPSFYASGELARPGRYELRSETTLMQAISEAGGLLNERAKKSQVIIFRPLGSGTYESHVIDVKDLLKKSSFEDSAIYPGDIIYVPQNRMSKIQRYIPNPGVGANISTF